MKTKNGKSSVWLIVFLTLVCTLLFSACTEFGTFRDQGLDAKTERAILKSARERGDKRPWIFDYLGTYKGASVIIFCFGNTCLHYAEPKTEVIAEIEFGYTTISKPIEVWKNGKFYSLQKAYDLGLLTLKDLQDIHGLYNPFKN